MILFLGVTVGGIVISMYLPLFDLISKLCRLGRCFPGRSACRSPRIPCPRAAAEAADAAQGGDGHHPALIAIYVEAMSEPVRAVNPLYFLIIATYLLTLGAVMLLRLACRASAPRVRPGHRRPARRHRPRLPDRRRSRGRLHAALPALGAVAAACCCRRGPRSPSPGAVAAFYASTLSLGAGYAARLRRLRPAAAFPARASCSTRSSSWRCPASASPHRLLPHGEPARRRREPRRAAEQVPTCGS